MRRVICLSLVLLALSGCGQKAGISFELPDSLGWNAQRLATRTTQIAKSLREENPFSNIAIEIDNSLPPGLTRAKVVGNKATLFVPDMVGETSFDQAYIVALIQKVAGNKKYDTASIEAICKKQNAALPPLEQVFSDLAFSLSTWIDPNAVSPELHSYTLRQSINYGHIFSPQFSYGDLTLSTETSFEQVIDQAFVDGSNPSYGKLLERLDDPPRIGIVASDSGTGIIVDEVAVGGPAEVAGVLPTDVVIEIDSLPVTQKWQLENALFDKKDNQYVILKVRRKKEMGTAKSTTFEADADKSYIRLMYQVLLSRKSALPNGVL